MSSKRIIGFIISNPEAVYQQRVMDGLFEQCRKYGYDCAVFAPMVQSCLFFKEYLQGELNIFELINFDKLDGVIVATLSLTDDNTVWVKEYVEQLLKERCRKPVISLDMPLADYPVVYTNDRNAFSEITAHLLDIHKCERIYFLTGGRDHAVSKQRLQGFLDLMQVRGIDVPDEWIFYGDFWYSSGEALADRIARGEIACPDAVICASDHMAIGLANRLVSKGINIPDDVIVTGYDATAEAVINGITITSFIPDIAAAAAKAVNAIVKANEPDRELFSPAKGETGLKICASCGCPENLPYIKKRLSGSLFNVNHNWGDEEIMDHTDISRLIDSYMFENFASSESIYDCFEKIVDSQHLIRPFEKYYLCLDENWTDTDRCTVKGYSPVMKMPVLCVSNLLEDGAKKESHVTIGSEYNFDTELMLPQLYEEHDHSCVYYFTAMHFREKSLGYSVLQCDAAEKCKVGIVYRNWIRNVNNALEMIRVQNRLTVFSEKDAMTGLYNRRGMETHLKELTDRVPDGSNCLVFVIDMDGLKVINDTYGHAEGDYGITAVASAVRQMSRSTEICVRAGGDEFYIIGIGEYRYIDAIVRVEKFKAALLLENEKEKKPYEISASIGFCCEPFSSTTNINDFISLADSRMYKNKQARKKARR